MGAVCGICTLEKDVKALASKMALFEGKQI